MGLANKKYGAEDIEVLEGLEPVRKRPGMFIAGTDTTAGLHQLVYEIVDNSVDEAMNGHCNEIIVTLHDDGSSVSVSDNGRGIPVEKHPKYKISTLELILTTLHAGGKFSDKNYKTAGGLHGVGSSVVNALSEELIATVFRDGAQYQQKFSRGLSTTQLKKSSSTRKNSGTTIFFRPDSEIFKITSFSSDQIRETLKTKAYLNPGLKVIFKDETKNTTEEFLYNEGLVAYLREYLAERSIVPIGGEPIILEREAEIFVSIALCWTEETKEEFLSYVNGIFTTDGGSHEIGAKAGIVKAVKNYIAVHDIQTKGLKLIAEDFREGIFCLVSVKLPGGTHQAQFQGQTKSKLNNPEVAPIVESVAKNIEQILNEKPSLAEAVVNRVLLSARARTASRQAVDTIRRKTGISHRLNLPGKLADCSSSRSNETELFIVEGDSAGGSAKQGRDRNTQAILPLRGKVLNTVTSSNKKLLENKELLDIVSALGCGLGEACNPNKMRYGKLIILTDADADGMHIATLLLAFFFKYLRPLIDKGHLYLGKAPLYGIFPHGGKKSQESVISKSKKPAGKSQKIANKQNVHWAYSDDELNKIISNHKLENPRISRYKGLGEMNPDTLWETTLNPKTRTLLRVSLKDQKLVEDSFEALMGNDSSTRYRLIQENAASIEIDV